MKILIGNLMRDCVFKPYWNLVRNFCWQNVSTKIALQSLCIDSCEKIHALIAIYPVCPHCSFPSKINRCQIVALISCVAGLTISLIVIFSIYASCIDINFCPNADESGEFISISVLEYQPFKIKIWD